MTHRAMMTRGQRSAPATTVAPNFYSLSEIDLASASSRASASGYTGNYLEYIGLAVHDGTAHGLWSDNRNLAFIQDAWTDAVSFTSAGGGPVGGGGNILTVTGDDAESPWMTTSSFASAPPTTTTSK